MKKILSLLLVATFILTGCSFGSKTKKPKGDGYIYSYDETDLFEQYGKVKKISELPANSITEFVGDVEEYTQSELKELDKDLSYREIKWTDEDFHIYIMIINDSNKSYDITSFVKFKTSDGSWSYGSEIADVRVAPHSSALLTYAEYKDAVDYAIDHFVVRATDDKYIGNNDFEYERYEKDLEGSFKYINSYFTFKGNGNNLSELKFYCVKDGKIKAHAATDFFDVDGGDGYGAVGEELNKKGQKAIAKIPYSSDMDDCDSFVYFVEGYYED